MLSTGSRMTVRAALFAWTVTSSLTGCKDEAPVAPAPSPVVAHIVNTTPAAQLIGTVGTTLSSAVSVQVQDANGKPMSGVPVTWTALDGGTVITTTATSDAQGNATATWTLGTVAGVDSLQAAVAPDIWTEVVATAQAGSVAQLIEISGDQQQLPEGATSKPLVVQAEDQYGNAVMGATVTWLDENGGALSGSTTVTDANGLAQVTLTTDTTPEQYVIIAQAAATSVAFVEVSN